MSLRTVGTIVNWLMLYVAVFILLANMGVYVAVWGAVEATGWVMKNCN